MITNKKYTKLKYDGFESHLNIEERAFDGWHWQVEFDNGCAVSVIKHRYSYGCKDDLFEIMRFCRHTGKEDVYGYLTNTQVLNALRITKALR